MSGHRIRIESEPKDIWTEATWSRAYEDAVQWRDWMTCELMLQERENESWWLAK